MANWLLKPQAHVSSWTGVVSRVTSCTVDTKMNLDLVGQRVERMVEDAHYVIAFAERAFEAPQLGHHRRRSKSLALSNCCD